MAENALRTVTFGQLPETAAQVRRGVAEPAEELGRLFVLSVPQSVSLLSSTLPEWARLPLGSFTVARCPKSSS